MQTVIWYALDPAKSDYGALKGARVGPCTILELSDRWVVVGHASFATREAAVQFASNGRAGRGDRHISAATFNSWKA